MTASDDEGRANPHLPTILRLLVVRGAGLLSLLLSLGLVLFFGLSDSIQSCRGEPAVLGVLWATGSIQSLNLFWEWRNRSRISVTELARSRGGEATHKYAQEPAWPCSPCGPSKIATFQQAIVVLKELIYYLQWVVPVAYPRFRV